MKREQFRLLIAIAVLALVLGICAILFAIFAPESAENLRGPVAALGSMALLASAGIMAVDFAMLVIVGAPGTKMVRYRVRYHGDPEAGATIDLEAVARYLYNLAKEIGRVILSWEMFRGKLRLYIELPEGPNRKFAETFEQLAPTIFPSAEIALIAPKTDKDLGDVRHAWRRPFDYYFVAYPEVEQLNAQGKRVQQNNAMTLFLRLIGRKKNNAPIMGTDAEIVNAATRDRRASRLVDFPTFASQIGPECELRIHIRRNGVAITVGADTDCQRSLTVLIDGPVSRLTPPKPPQPQELRKQGHVVAPAYNRLYQWYLNFPLAAAATESLGRSLFLPQKTAQYPDLDAAFVFAVPLPTDYSVEPPQLTIGYTLDGQPVGITVNRQITDAFRHFQILGQTGSGKSFAVHKYALQLIGMGCSLVVLDPHGDLVRDIYRDIPDKDEPRAALVDFDEPLNAPHINPMALDGGSIENTVSRLMGWIATITRITETTFPRGYNLLQAVMTLMLFDADRRGVQLTLQELYSALIKPDHIRTIVDANQDEPGLDENVRAFLQEDFQLLDDAEIMTYASSVRTRLSVMMNNKTVQAFLSPPFVSLAELINNGGVFLMRLPTARGQNKAADAYGKLLVSAILRAVMARDAIEKEKRHPTIVICDEAHNYVTDDILTALFEVRKYLSGFMMANQTLAAAQVDPLLGKPMTSQTANKIILKVGRDDAQQLAPFFQSGGINAGHLMSPVKYGGFAVVLNGGDDVYASIKTPAKIIPVQQAFPTYFRFAAMPLDDGTGQVNYVGKVDDGGWRVPKSPKNAIQTDNAPHSAVQHDEPTDSVVGAASDVSAGDGKPEPVAAPLAPSAPLSHPMQPPTNELGDQGDEPAFDQAAIDDPADQAGGTSPLDDLFDEDDAPIPDVPADPALAAVEEWANAWVEHKYFVWKVMTNWAYCQQLEAAGGIRQRRLEIDRGPYGTLATAEVEIAHMPGVYKVTWYHALGTREELVVVEQQSKTFSISPAAFHTAYSWANAWKQGSFDVWEKLTAPDSLEIYRQQANMFADGDLAKLRDFQDQQMGALVDVQIGITENGVIPVNWKFADDSIQTSPVVLKLDDNKLQIALKLE